MRGDAALSAKALWHSVLGCLQDVSQSTRPQVLLPIYPTRRGPGVCLHVPVCSHLHLHAPRALGGTRLYAIPRRISFGLRLLALQVGNLLSARLGAVVVGLTF